MRSRSAWMVFLGLLFVATPVFADGYEGGMVIGGPLGGSILPGSEGGMVIGGPLGGSILPGNEGGMVIGGPLGGSLLPRKP